MSTNLQSEIKKIILEIEMNDLVLPTEFEFEIAELVITNIKRFIPSQTFPYESNYSKELKKAYIELNKHFKYDLNFNSKFTQSFYHPTNEISDKVYKILNKITINQNTYEDYKSIFEIQPGKILPVSLDIPYQLDALSYIYLGHEIIHLLKDTNLNEYKTSLKFSEILPMLYEFIQLKYKRIDTRKNIISQRIILLSSMSQNVIKAKNLLGNTTEFNIFKLLDYQYFISFYYTILLYNLYNKHPNDILREFKKVLLHEKTTKEILEYFEIYEQTKIDEFNKGYERLLKIVS